MRTFKNPQMTPTLTANMGTGGHNVPIVIEDLEKFESRKLTPLECFRLQGFPDDIVEVARKIGISDTQLYKMVGNAVTVQVVQSIVRKIRRVFFGGG